MKKRVFVFFLNHVSFSIHFSLLSVCVFNCWIKLISDDKRFLIFCNKIVKSLPSPQICPCRIEPFFISQLMNWLSFFHFGTYNESRFSCSFFEFYVSIFKVGDQKKGILKRCPPYQLLQLQEYTTWVHSFFFSFLFV